VSADGSIYEKLLADAPRFHQHLGEEVSHHNRNVAKIERYLTPGMRTLETGAGYSTVIFAGRGCMHVAITPRQREADLISAYCREHGYPVPRFVVGESWEMLPGLRDLELDFVLIDGSHAHPHPMIDWFYATRLLKRGGLVFVDDTHLLGPFIPARYMAFDLNWKAVLVEDTIAVYRKLRRFEQDAFTWKQEALDPAEIERLKTTIRDFWPERAGSRIRARIRNRLRFTP
jgi:predicted O-methyltransferase YrrM